MKKYIALFLASVMTMSLAVAAAPSSSAGGGSSTPVVVPVAPAPVVTAPAAPAAPSNEPAADVKAVAAANNVSVEELANNAVSTVPGIATAVPVAQQGFVIVNGAASRQKLSLAKPNKAAATAAVNAAAVLCPAGTVISCVDVKAGFKFDTAIANFYVKGLKATDKVVAFQLVNGAWVPVVIAVRADHVDALLTTTGRLMFVKIG